MPTKRKARALQSSRLSRRRKTKGTKERKIFGEPEKQWTGPFFFIQLADPQFGMMTRAVETSPEELEMLSLAVKHINRFRPKFVVVCGDLIDAFPSTSGVCKQTREFKRVVANIDPSIPLVCCCGNHDVGNVPTVATVAAYKKQFGPDYLHFWAGGCKCIVLNTQLYACWKGGDSSYIKGADVTEAKTMARAQDRWLNRTLEAARRARHSLVFCHIPPFIQDPQEPDGYFNLPRKVRGPLLRRLRAGGVKAVFSGHFHRNAGGWDDTGATTGTRSAPLPPLEVVVTGAIGGHLPNSESSYEAGEAGQRAMASLGGIDYSKKRCNVDVSGLRVVRVGAKDVSHRWFSVRQIGQVRSTSALLQRVGATSSPRSPCPLSHITSLVASIHAAHPDKLLPMLKVPDAAAATAMLKRCPVKALKSIAAQPTAASAFFALDPRTSSALLRRYPHYDTVVGLLCASLANSARDKSVRL